LNSRKKDVLAWESRWTVPAGLLTFGAVIAVILALILLSSVHGENSAELLESAHEHSSSVIIASVIQAIGFLLLTAPLYFLFRAASARSDRMRRQFVGVILVAPLFFAISAVCTGVALNEAADEYAKGEAKPTITVEKAHEECVKEEEDKGAKAFGEKYDEGATPLKDCETKERQNDAADNARGDATFTGPATGFELAGRIGLAFALGYTCLYAMRVGLLTRFWGSLGIAVGVAALLLIPQFTMIFFIYFALLLVGKLPRGRPPAWEAGEAVPWPTPGERMAQELEPKNGGVGPDEDDLDAPELPEGTEAPEPDSAPEPDDDGTGGSSPGGPPRKKRKRRN
jgi:amino acid transporter